MLVCGLFSVLTAVELAFLKAYGESRFILADRSKGARTMPTYAYRCEKCGEHFERVEPMSEHGAQKPQCPKCGSEQTQAIAAPFTAKTSKKS
jgi:putative FmdB family regulatory protein